MRIPPRPKPNDSTLSGGSGAWFTMRRMTS